MRLIFNGRATAAERPAEKATQQATQEKAVQQMRSDYGRFRSASIARINRYTDGLPEHVKKRLSLILALVMFLVGFALLASVFAQTTVGLPPDPSLGPPILTGPITQPGVPAPQFPTVGNPIGNPTNGIPNTGFLDSIVATFSAAAPAFLTASAGVAATLFRLLAFIEALCVGVDMFVHRLDGMFYDAIQFMLKLLIISEAISHFKVVTTDFMGFFQFVGNKMGAAVGVPENLSGNGVWGFGWDIGQQIGAVTPNDPVGALMAMGPQLASVSAITLSFGILAFELSVLNVLFVVATTAFGWWIAFYICRFTAGYGDNWPRLVIGIGISEITLRLMIAMGSSMSHQIIATLIQSKGGLTPSLAGVIIGMSIAYAMVSFVFPIVAGIMGGSSNGISTAMFAAAAGNMYSRIASQLGSWGAGGSGGGSAFISPSGRGLTDQAVENATSTQEV